MCKEEKWEMKRTEIRGSNHDKRQVEELMLVYAVHPAAVHPRYPWTCTCAARIWLALPALRN